jgi:hypothetical protein
MPAYVPPSKRSKAVVQITSLAPEHFPAFGAVAPSTRSKLNFVGQIQKAEEERATEAANRYYDPTNIVNLTHSQLRNEGWEILKIQRTPTWINDWNTRVFSDRVPSAVIPKSLPTVKVYQADDDYMSEDE